MAGWPVIVIGLSSILASWAYSAGPWPFGRHGFADPLFFLFFGTMSVIGTYYVQAAVVLGPQHWREALPLTAVAVSLPIGALITNILIIDDIRDRDFDVVKGKNTIAVRFGKSWSRTEFLCLLAFAYLAPFWLWLALGFSAFVLLPLLTLPLAALVAHAVWTRDRFDELVPMTPRMAMLTVGLLALPGGRGSRFPRPEGAGLGRGSSASRTRKQNARPRGRAFPSSIRSSGYSAGCVRRRRCRRRATSPLRTRADGAPWPNWRRRCRRPSTRRPPPCRAYRDRCARA